LAGDGPGKREESREHDFPPWPTCDGEHLPSIGGRFSDLQRDALKSILEYTVDGRDACFDDKKTQAVIRNIEIVGEATKRLSDAFRAQHPAREVDPAACR